MRSIEFPLKIVSPVFSKGANSVELRPQSVRGQVRFWLRAMLGAATDDPEEVFLRESLVFGSTQMGSSCSFRVVAKNTSPVKYEVLPHRRQGKNFKDDAVDINTPFSLSVTTRPGVPFPDDLRNGLLTWLLLGGLGKRSRRMFGAIQPGGIPDGDYVLPEWVRNWDELDSADFAGIVRQFLEEYIQAEKIEREPSFPTLHPEYSRVIVGRPSPDYNDPEAANKALFSITRNDTYRRNQHMLGSGSPRRASSLIAQIRRFRDGYVPIITLMRSPIEGKADWSIMDNLMDDLEAQFEGQTVWGGKVNR